MENLVKQRTKKRYHPRKEVSSLDEKLLETKDNQTFNEHRTINSMKNYGNKFKSLIYFWTCNITSKNNAHEWEGFFLWAITQFTSTKISPKRSVIIKKRYPSTLCYITKTNMWVRFNGAFKIMNKTEKLFWDLSLYHLNKWFAIYWDGKLNRCKYRRFNRFIFIIRWYEMTATFRINELNRHILYSIA